MALDRIIYDVVPFTRELDQLGNLFYVERLVVEVNTNNSTLTPTFNFEVGSVALTGQTNSAQGMLEFTVNRLGPLLSVELAPAVAIDWFGVELFVRPLNLGVVVVGRGLRVDLPGRTSDATANLIFDINPFAFPEDARHISPVVRRLWLDIQTGTNTVTPTLNFDDGTASTLAGITQVGRAVVELNVLQAKRVKNITLAGNFADGQVVLYDIEADVYLPSTRRLAVG